MKSNVLTFGRVLGLCLLAAAIIPLAGCQAKPDEVATQLAEAVNAQDLDAALALFAEDAVVNSASPEPFTGKAEIKGWLEGMFADSFKLKIEILQVEDDTVLERDVIRMDSLRDLGIASLEGTSDIVVQGGKITALSFAFTEESLAKLQVATINGIPPTHADVPYHDDGDPMHTLDVYLPEGAEGPLPTVFAIHGGDGSKKDLHGLAGYFVQSGYAAVLPQIRHKNEPDRPLLLQDAFCSLAWVHANADAYGFDPRRIVVFGYSMGGGWVPLSERWMIQANSWKVAPTRSPNRTGCKGWRPTQRC